MFGTRNWLPLSSQIVSLLTMLVQLQAQVWLEVWISIRQSGLINATNATNELSDASFRIMMTPSNGNIFRITGPL